MKKNYLIWQIFVLWGVWLNAQQLPLDKQFYYYKGEKNYLQIDFSRISIISKGKINMDNIKGIVNSLDFSIKNEERNYTRQNVVPIDDISRMMQNEEIFITEMKFSEALNQTEYFDIIQHLSEENNIIKIVPAYSSSNQDLGISNNFYVKIFKKEDLNNLFDLAKEYSIEVLGHNEFLPLWFTLSCSRESPFGAIEAANMFFETSLFERAEPEFLYHNLLTSNDEYFSDQWGLKNTGQYNGIAGFDIKAEQAWTITTGNNVRVAVFDHGFEMDHPDLINNAYGIGYDATTNRRPAQVRGSHGTACAGIIGARYNNSTGIAGVSPNAKILSISGNFTYADTPQQLANGFSWSWKNGADIISNSWGGYTPSSIIEEAIDSALTHGRNGKGTIVVFSSGNSKNSNSTNTRYPGNSNPDILVVGAMSPCGERKNYFSCDGEYRWLSCYGTQLDVVAPGVLIPTTDRQGANGYNPDNHMHTDVGGNKILSDYTNLNYTVWFNGTSAACPHVSGVAALILSVNPDLTGQQVRNIIESTAQKIRTDLYDYSTIPGRPNGTWNEEMGYGLVDAYAAVRAAQATLSSYNLVGTFFPFVYRNRVAFDTLFNVTATLHSVPGLSISNPLDAVFSYPALYTATVVRYDGSIYVPGTPKYPGWQGYTSNPGYPVNWSSIGQTQGEVNPITVAPGEVPVNPVGLYFFEGVAPGTYILKLSRAGYVPRLTKITISSAGLPFLGHREIVGGDVNNDFIVTPIDVLNINNKSGLFFTLPGYDPKYDIDGNGQIDNADVSLVKFYLGFDCRTYKDTQEWASEYDED